MSHAIKLSDLASLSSEQRRMQLEAMAVEPVSAPNGELSAVVQGIERFERQYDMPSETMKKRFREGLLRETTDISDWLMMLDVRDHL